MLPMKQESGTLRSVRRYDMLKLAKDKKDFEKWKQGFDFTVEGNPPRKYPCYVAVRVDNDKLRGERHYVLQTTHRAKLMKQREHINKLIHRLDIAIMKMERVS